MVTHFFVYGTLQLGQSRGQQWPRPALRTAPGFLRGQLFDLGPYPAFVEGPGVVCGQLRELAVPDVPLTLQVLDAIEGYRGAGQANLYQRVIAKVHASGELSDRRPTLAYCYRMDRDVLPRNATKITSPARWPAANQTPHALNLLPDPFPDDLPC